MHLSTPSLLWRMLAHTTRRVDADAAEGQGRDTHPGLLSHHENRGTDREENMDYAIAAQFLTALGVILGVLTLVATHERGRREFAAKLIWDWTLNARRNTRAATLIVDTLTRVQCRAIYENKAFRVEASLEDLLRIVLSDRPDVSFPEKQDGHLLLTPVHSSVLRAATQHYLNLLESIFVCRQHRVADRKLVEMEFSSMIYPAKGKIYLHEYIEAAGGLSVYPAVYAYAQELRDRDIQQAGRDRGNAG